MRKTVAAILATLITGPALAQTEPGTIELTPYGAYSFGGTFEDEESTETAELQDSGSFGLIFDYQLKNNTQVEVIYSLQRTDAVISDVTISDVNMHYLQLGGTYQFDEVGKVLPFMSATLGGTHVEVDSQGFGSDTFFGFSIGGGIQIAPSSRVGLRLEARAFGTALNSGSTIFCVSNPGGGQAGCAITVAGDVLWQLQAMAGIVFRF
ncbi:MAG: outer membrane beta-barrel protein [Gammaproteobacteria bacterium]|nr:outer membrane beta-barrel protein [Gammaproteobacteria bacterium]